MSGTNWSEMQSAPLSKQELSILCKDLATRANLQDKPYTHVGYSIRNIGSIAAMSKRNEPIPSGCPSACSHCFSRKSA